MSTWRLDVPVELEDGTLCCSAHLQVVCGVCCVDYSFMQDSGDESEDVDDEPEDSSGSKTSDDENNNYAPWLPLTHDPPPMTRIMAFTPPNPADTPQTLFAPRNPANPMCPNTRFVRRSNPREILIYTDGACLGNGQPNPTAGCAFVFRPSSSSPTVNGSVSFRLELKGPSGRIYPQTSNRAELRAVIAALQFRAWSSEGWNRLVIASDSEYVVKGATEWVLGWERNGWITRQRKSVKNRDLWEELLKELRKHHSWGLQVVFWRIPRELNTEADSAAKEAAEREGVEDFGAIFGVLV